MLSILHKIVKRVAELKRTRRAWPFVWTYSLQGSPLILTFRQPISQYVFANGFNKSVCENLYASHLTLSNEFLFINRFMVTSIVDGHLQSSKRSLDGFLIDSHGLKCSLSSLENDEEGLGMYSVRTDPSSIACHRDRCILRWCLGGIFPRMFFWSNVILYIHMH